MFEVVLLKVLDRYDVCDYPTSDATASLFISPPDMPCIVRF
jgi:hypothetical protein